MVYGICGKWKHLEVIDRSDGTKKRIPLRHKKSAESVYFCAENLGLPAAKIWDRLQDGQSVTTVGFIRKLTH